MVLQPENKSPHAGSEAIYASSALLDPVHASRGHGLLLSVANPGFSSWGPRKKQATRCIASPANHQVTTRNIRRGVSVWRRIQSAALVMTLAGQDVD